MSDPMEPVDVQNRRRLAFGEAWDRAEAALPEHWILGSLRSRTWDALTTDGPRHVLGVWRARAVAPLRVDEALGEGQTPTEALDALTAELERRSLLEPNRGES